MTPRRRFIVALAAFTLVWFAYGLRRFGLGVDFTDEGAYASWPLRVFFGERLFAGDPLLLLRPLLNHLSVLYRLRPEITLYELRLLGWTLHLGAFASLATCLFRLSGAPLRSLLIASIPLFACHLFGLAVPSYNSLSSDFFLIALSLRSVSLLEDTGWKRTLAIASGIALFLATLAHPALGAVAALLLLLEIWPGKLLGNLFRRQVSVSNLGLAAFVACWLGYVTALAASGAGALWLDRIGLDRSLAVSPLAAHPVRFVFDLLAAPFTFSLPATVFSLASLVTIGVAGALKRARRQDLAAGSSLVLVLLSLVSLIHTFSDDAQFLPLCFTQVTLLFAGALGLGIWSPVTPAFFPLRSLFSASVAAALLYASATYYFSPLRSWTSGILALPFPFAVGLMLLTRSPPGRPRQLYATILAVVLAFTVACVAREHDRFIYRDRPAVDLTATFHTPKLRHLHSTPERAAAVDALYDYLHPRLARGESLVAFDDCPLLYFILEAKPAYGLTWAVRYTQSPANLALHDRELRAAPLPRYAVRTLVDLSNPVWSIAPRTRYGAYPLNDTVTTRYELEQTIFPFEVWRLKSDPVTNLSSPGKKASP